MARKKPATTNDETPFAPVTEADVKAQADSGSFSRGRAYFREGRIHETVLRDSTIEALCEGSEIVPYRVRSTLPLREEPVEQLLTCSCTCPRGGFCKHIVALLLTWIHKPERFETRPPLTDLLAGKSREDLVALVARMVQRYPDLERLVELPSPSASAGSANEVTIDAAVIRRQARTAFSRVDSYDYDHEWGAPVPGATDVYGLLELGQGYVATGEWANAQVVLTNLAEEIGETILSFVDDEGEFSNILTECDAGLAACLDAQAGLPKGERLNEEIRERLITAIYNIWRFDIFEAGGLDLAQAGPDAIARNVTDAERATVEGWLRDEKPDQWGKSSVVGFLVMLREQSGLDDQQLLELYREYELWDDVAAMLLHLDRVDEAVAIARRHITVPFNLVAFGSALIQRGDQYAGQALSLVDDHLWEVEGKNPVQDAVLQDWLTAQLGSHDRPGDALAMAERRFKGQPTLHTYQLVREAANLPGQEPGAWASARPKLHEHLRAKGDWPVLVDACLEDGDVAAALDAFDKLGKQRQRGAWYESSWGYGDQDLRLAQAAEQDFPDRAVAIYREQAERQIAQRQRSHYKEAARHLARVKATLEAHGRAGEWQESITELRTTHKTLRALREELDALDLR